MPLACFKTIFFQHRTQNRLQFGERPRADDEAVAVPGQQHRRSVVDQIVGPVASAVPAAVVEEFDAHVPIDGEHPITRVVNFADQRSFLRVQFQTNDRPCREVGGRPGYRCGGRRDQRRQLAQQ